MATYQSSKKNKKNKKPQPDRSVFGTYVAPIFSTIGNQFTGRAALFGVDKSKTQKGRDRN
jgi:hypothetical protein